MPAKRTAKAAHTGQLARIIAHAGGVGTSTSATAPEAYESLADGALRIAAYCRYSSHNQDSGFSLEAQHEAVEREAAAVGNWHIRYYDEPATSAYTEDLSKRPVFLGMLADALAGLIDVVVVHRLDRFSRNIGITSQVVPALLEAGVQFISLTERLDATTPAGQLMLHMIGSFAEFESSHKGARISDGKRQRAKSGLHTCRVPYGYRSMGTSAHAVPDTAPEGAEDADSPTYSWNGLQRLFGLALAGQADYTISQTLNREGYRLTTPTRARNADGSADRSRLFTPFTISVLRRQVYYRPYAPGDDRGTVKHDGVEYRGQHIAAIDYERWQQLQAIARNRRWGFGAPDAQIGRHPGIPYTAEFRGLAVCGECGSRLYVWRSVHHPEDEATRRTYERYTCTARDHNAVCSHDRQWARVEDVRALWLAWIREHMALPADWQQMVQARIQERHNSGAGATPQTTRTAAQLRTERLRWAEKRDRAVEVYAEGLKDRAWMEARVAEANAAMLALDRAEAPKEVQRVRLLDAGRYLVDLADAWERATTEQRIVLASHLIVPGGLHLDLHGARGQVNRWHPVEARETPMSCTIARVDLQPAFRDLLATLHDLTA